VGGKMNKSNEKILKDSLYSLDKLTVEFEMSKDKVQQLMNKYSMNVNFEQWESKQLSKCRYNYTVSLDDDHSFYIGFCPNWKKRDAYIDTGRVEFNPTKVGYDLVFQSIYGEILSFAGMLLKPLKFDLAIDLPVARDKVHLIKDKRTYEEYSNSQSDRTQYLGKRNAPGRVKIYNKALESKLDIDLTRLEITVDYDNRSVSEVGKLIPEMYILDSFQFSIDMPGTDKVIMLSVLSDLSLLKILGRKKAEKIKAYLADMQLNLSLDTEKYNQVLDTIQTYLK
jgi:hypothetical protein